MPAFARHIGIDYSGAETPSASLKGPRYLPGCGRCTSRRNAATVTARILDRRGIAEWLAGNLAENGDMVMTRAIKRKAPFGAFVFYQCISDG